MPDSATLDRILVSPEESMRDTIAELFCNSLGERLAWPILPSDRAEIASLIVDSLDLSEVYVGLDAKGGMLAFAFVTDQTGEPLCLKGGWMREVWGPWGGLWRAALFNAVHFPQNMHHALRVEAFVVRPEWRGKGIGSQLMRRILADARAKGHPFVTIDVDEENKEARHLYEDLGFRITRTLWAPCRERPGLRSVLVMRLDL